MENKGDMLRIKTNFIHIMAVKWQLKSAIGFIFKFLNVNCK